MRASILDHRRGIPIAAIAILIIASAALFKYMAS
jgi:hypothetical protein